MYLCLLVEEDIVTHSGYSCVCKAVCLTVCFNVCLSGHICFIIVFCYNVCFLFNGMCKNGIVWGYLSVCVFVFVSGVFGLCFSVCMV